MEPHQKKNIKIIDRSLLTTLWISVADKKKDLFVESLFFLLLLYLLELNSVKWIFSEFVQLMLYVKTNL